ncbi:MAG: class I SAM-dependent methyltransferase [Alphaproteobacteria bacterium]|nr:class I SAM-dependent methyltransferase [Alphaproteobacteria bacterium]
MAMSRLETVFDLPELAPTQGENIAVLRARSDVTYRMFDKDHLSLANSFRPTFDRLSAQGFDVSDQIEGSFPRVLVHITRSKIETLGLIARGFEICAPGGLVVVDGAKTDGIDSALKQCKSLGFEVGALAKSHGKTFWMRRPPIFPETLDAWRSGLQISQNKDGFWTAPGMFSPGKTDPGSALLATHFGPRLKGQIADLGAGWGWLSMQAFAHADPTGIDLYEAENTALAAALANISDERATFIWSDVQALTTDQRYDAVICNPPFHQGRAAEPAIGVDFINKAADILKPNGRLWMVANRQLPYEHSLEQCFGHCKTLEQTPHFKVFLAEKPRSAPFRARQLSATHSR